MRAFDRTREPAGRVGHTDTGRSFVVQKHAARRLHYDLRLEHDGVLLSWAVPKGPSLAVGDRRLAVRTEDHPVDYRDFEGTIPEGQYGGGQVIVWDRGTWRPLEDPDEGLRSGHLDFELDGERLHGRFTLVRTKGDEKKPTWLLMKRSDAFATTGPGADITLREPVSILTGRTIEDVRAGVPARAANDTRGRRRTRGAELPAFASLSPELATLVKGVPASGPWVYEIKYDGYRALAWLDDGEVRIASRHGLDWTSKVRGIAAALSRVRARTAIFDGEIAYVRPDGRTDFQKLQNTLGSNHPEEEARLVYFVFDLLFYDGVDVRGAPLTRRKDLLRTILAGEGPPLMMSEHLEDGATFLREACKAGLEGIMGKRADRPYVSGRTKDWIKVKCQKRQELVIVGYTPPKGTRRGIGALLLGATEGKGRLRYVGKVGTGFSNETLKDLAGRLSRIEIDRPAVVDPPRMRAVRWVKPELVGQIRFAEWTSDGVLRHPSFEGLRLDKPARDVHREIAQPTPRAAPRRGSAPEVDGVTISHPDRVVDPKTGLTKLDLARYAAAIAGTMLPFVERRPLMLFRCPDGTEEAVFRQSDRRRGKKTSCFVQKHSGVGLGDVNLGSGRAGDEEVLYVTKPRQIVHLAQQNAVEIHGWGSTMPRWDRPDWIVLDLDPDEPLPWTRVVDAALEVRGALRTLGLESWVKTTGGKGLHVVVPIARRYDWATVKGAAHAIARLLARAAPDRYVATMSKRARAGRIFIDYLRNGEGATAILPYSARARPGLPVAVPIEWDDLRALHPQELTIETVPGHVARRGADPWAALMSTRQTLPRELLAAAVE
jgi:bifunctional non-homologous end joining protein LigD